MPGPEKDKETEQEKRDRLKGKELDNCIKYNICPPKKDTFQKYEDGINKGKKILPKLKATAISKSGTKIEKSIEVDDKIECVTYHIYWNTETEGKIEKHIPKEITQGYENKYRYIYHDKENKEHEICTVDWVEITSIGKGSKVAGAKTVPAGYIETYKYPRGGGGDAKDAYVYENGYIYVIGASYGIRRYPKEKGKIIIVRMKDSLSYSNRETKIYYTFHNSDRRYCSPECYAGFIGALGELNRTDIQSTGMCFGDGTSYPSVSHNNGRSVDTRYLSNLEDEKKKVLAFKKFFFTDVITGTYTQRTIPKGWYGYLPSHKHMEDHNDHLHAGVINTSKVIEK